MRRLFAYTVIAALVAGCGPCAPADDAPTRGETSGAVNAEEHAGKPHVVLISFDGFRPDYVERAATPALDRMAREGVRAEALVPVFPTKTFPNHYTIATGMYPQEHGIVGNAFYDPARDETYSLRDREAVMDGTWYRGEPIWVTAESQGMVSASFFWVGSEADVQGVRPTDWTTYDSRVPHDERVDQVIGWLKRPAERRPHLITLYFSEVDSAGHRHGPDSPQVARAIESVDAALGRLVDGIDRLPIRDEVYLVLVSDHGMAPRVPDKAEAIDEIIDMEGVRMTSSGPAANLHVEGGPERAADIRDALDAGLRHGRAYLREETPAHLRYREDPRIGDVVVLMDEHWEIGVSSDLPRPPGGAHGWDPRIPSMHGIFFISGPGVRAGATIEAFESVHVYPLLAEILDLEPGPDVEGEAGLLWGRVTESAVAE